MKKNQDMEYYNNPIEETKVNPPKEEERYFEHFAKNEPESSWDVMNAHSMQIQNKALTTLYRTADATIGWALPDEQKEKLQLSIEQMREDYLATENAINKYINNYAGGAEAVALSFGGMIYRGIADPVNVAANVATGGMSTGYMVLANFLIDTAQYTADTSFYEKRNVFTDPKLEDFASIGLNTAMSVGTVKLQAKYKPTNTSLYDESGELFVKNFPKNTDELTEIELKNNAPQNDIPPLERMATVNERNPELLKTMQDRGYDTLLDTQAFGEVAQRQIYGQPQANYTIQGVKDSVHNALNSVLEMNAKYQSELYEDDFLEVSSVAQRDEITYAVKPLKVDIENSIDFYIGEYAKELSSIVGYNSSTGDMIWDISQKLDKNMLVEGLLYKRPFASDEGGLKLYTFLDKQFSEYTKALGVENEYGKIVMYDKLIAKNKHQAAVRRAYNNDIEYAHRIGEFVGEKVELTKAEAEAVGLTFDPKKANKTLEKGQGGYADFEVEFKDLKYKVKDYVNKEKELNLKDQQKEIDDIREIYKKKADDIRRGRTSIQTEREILKGEAEEIRANRNSILETEGRKFNAEREKINTSYKTDVGNLKLERDGKIKEVKTKISELKKQETAEINKIQNDSKLYDPDKLPMAKRIQKENTKEIKKLQEEISKISKEYKQKISELEKKRNSDIEAINKQEQDLRNSFKKGTKEYLKNSKKNKEKFSRKADADVNRELRKLQDELDKQEALINRKYRDKKHNKYRILNSKLKKIDQTNYKKIYKLLKEYKDDFAEIKELGDLANSDGRYVQTNTYSIHDNPIEVMKAFYGDMSRTNRESKKMLNTNNLDIKEARDYRSEYFIAEKWGNKSGDPVDNFIKSAMGNEKETYEIITDILADNVEINSGMNEVKKLLNNLQINDSRYTKEFSLKEQMGMSSLTTENRDYFVGALNDMITELSPKKRIGPNLWIDPKEQKLNSNMTRRSIKGIVSAKYLGTLNYLKEIPTNNFRVWLGARKLGWNMKYTYLKDFTDGIKVTYELAKNFKNIRNNTLEGITDPVIRRRVQLFIDKKLANSITYNDVGEVIYKSNSKNSIIKYGQKIVKYKGLAKAQQGIEIYGNTMAVGQTVSDVQRIVSAELGAINYMLDILPKAKSRLLKKIFKTNGIGEADFKIINQRIADLGDEGLMDLVWSGKKLTNPIDFKIKSLFEQFSDVMGKEFDAYKRHDSGIVKGGNFLTDALYTFKRYSLGAVEGMVKALTTYIDDNGMIRRTFYSMNDFKASYKDAIKGGAKGAASFLLPFVYTGISGKLIYDIGIKKIQGEIFGGTDDERADAKFKSLLSIDGLAGFTIDAIQDNILNTTGIGIAIGGKTVVGSFYEQAIARAKRAYAAYANDDLNWAEAASLYFVTFVGPEPLARGIDHIKFDKNIPNRLTTWSETEQDIWRYDEKIDAAIEQIDGLLPYEIDTEKVKATVTDWISYWKKRPKEARIFMDAPNEIPDEIVVVGAAGVSGMMEETAETIAISELMTEEKDVREKRLKALGLDIDSQLKLMSREDNRDFNLILSLKQIRDEEEILMLAYNLNRSKDKKEFLKSILTNEEYIFLEDFKNRATRNKDKINSEIKRRSKRGIDGYIDSLNIIYELAE